MQQVGLILLGGVFVWAGAEHFLRFGAVSTMLEQRGFAAPRAMLAVGSAIEIVAGFCLAADIFRLCAAFALIAFTIAANLTLLNFWRFSGVERQGLRSAFTINIAVLGGLLLAAAG